MNEQFFGNMNQDVPVNNNSTQNAPNPQVSIGGNIPAELAAKLAARNINLSNNPTAEMQAPHSHPQSQPQPQPQVVQQQFHANTEDLGTKSKLDAILDALRSNASHYEEITLPSLGKFYDGTDGPADGKLHIKPMTGEEEQILATPRFVKKGQAINMIFSRCIKENYKVDNFLSVDRTFLLIYLRGISYGTEYEVEVKDPNSDLKFSTTIDLDSLPVERCPESYGPLLSDTFPKSGYKFFYRLSRGRDETALQEHRDRRLRVAGDSATDDSMMFRTAQLTESIEGLTDKNAIMAILKNLHIQDLNYIRNLVNDPPFGVDTKITIVSPSSSDEFEIELPLEANFFFPRSRKKESPPA